MTLRSLGLTMLVAASALASAQFYGYKDRPVPGSARVATDASSAEVRVDQRLNQPIPLNLQFTDEDGKKVLLADVINKRPVILLPIFYECPGICTDELNNLVKTVRAFKKDNVGDLFDIVCFSIDPTETYKLAASKKETYVDVYDRKGTDDGWHFLVGDDQNVNTLCRTIGFQFRRDKQGNIVHPAAAIVVTPAGKISQYFLSTEYSPRLMLNALKAAKAEAVGARDERPFYLACINVDPLTGQRSLNIVNTLKVSGLLTVLVLGGSMIAMNRKVKKNQLAEQGGTETSES